MNPEVLLLSCVGLGIVFAVLGALAAIIQWLRRLDEVRRPGDPIGEKVSLRPAGAIDPRMLVVISAAIAAACTRRHRIRGIRRLAPHAAHSSWSQQGRLTLQGSHRSLRLRHTGPSSSPPGERMARRRCAQ